MKHAVFLSQLSEATSPLIKEHTKEQKNQSKIYPGIGRHTHRHDDDDEEEEKEEEEGGDDVDDDDDDDDDVDDDDDDRGLAGDVVL